MRKRHTIIEMFAQFLALKDSDLAVQVNFDDRWLRVWGYATHQQLKNEGRYNEVERTYSLEREDLIEDLNIIWVRQKLCAEELENLLSPTSPLPSLSSAEVEKLLAQMSLCYLVTSLLGNASIKFVLLTDAAGLSQKWNIGKQSPVSTTIYDKKTIQLLAGRLSKTGKLKSILTLPSSETDTR